MLKGISKNVGVGIDIENIERFMGLSSDKNENFFNKVFTENELKYCFSKEVAGPHLAARYAGKEAVVKAISCLSNIIINYNEIEILNDENGLPTAKLNNKELNDIQINISLSHCDDKAVAFAIAIN